MNPYDLKCEKCHDEDSNVIDFGRFTVSLCPACHREAAREDCDGTKNPHNANVSKMDALEAALVGGDVTVIDEYVETLWENRQLCMKQFASLEEWLGEV